MCPTTGQAIHYTLCTTTGHTLPIGACASYSTALRMCLADPNTVKRFDNLESMETKYVRDRCSFCKEGRDTEKG